jgi:hypothetical protein
MKVLLISEETLKAETIINDNVDGAYLRPAIECAQDIFLHQLIGSYLLDTLCDMVKNNEIRPEYKELLDDYITPFLKYKVCSEITLDLAYKYRNAGVVQTQTDYVSNSIMKDAQTMKEFYDTRADFFAIRLTDYLCANSNSFPEWRNTRNSADMMGDKDSYNTNIYLG